MRAYRIVGALGMTASMVGAFACGGNNPSIGLRKPDSGTAAPGGSSGAGSGSSGSTGGSGSSSSGASVDRDGGITSGCGAGDPNMPAEPTIPPPCATLQATQAIAGGAVPDESALDTSTIQAALTRCPSGQSVQLVTNGAKNAFVSGPLSLPPGVTLWIDAGTTLFASRNPSLYGGACGTSTGSCTAFIRVGSGVANAGVMGDGTIDGQGGEPMIGQSQSWWDLTQASGGGAGNPPLIQASNAINFTMYRITLHNSPKICVKLASQGFVVWGVTVKTPSNATNSQGTPLSAANAQNTDGIDPGESASNGYIVCSKISVGDDQIAIKGRTGVNHLTIAHNHFGSGHGMSIGSETNGGVSDVKVYDLSIDGTNSGMGGGSSNGIRIKSDPSQGGPITNISYSDVCVREVVNAIILNPTYSATTGTLIPTFSGITIRDFHYLPGAVAPRVTLDGFDAAHMTDITLDNVVVEGITAARARASFANVTLGPGTVNFTPSGTNVSVTNSITGGATPNPCTDKWVTF